MDIEVIRQFGAWLEKSRKSRKITQQQLADATGVHRCTILALERGKAKSLSPVVKTSLESYFSHGDGAIPSPSLDLFAEIVADDDFLKRVNSVMEGLRVSKKEAIMTIIKNDLNMQ